MAAQSCLMPAGRDVLRGRWDQQQPQHPGPVRSALYRVPPGLRVSIRGGIPAPAGSRYPDLLPESKVFRSELGVVDPRGPGSHL